MFLETLECSCFVPQRERLRKVRNQKTISWSMIVCLFHTIML